MPGTSGSRRTAHASRSPSSIRSRGRSTSGSASSRSRCRSASRSRPTRTRAACGRRMATASRGSRHAARSRFAARARCCPNKSWRRSIRRCRCGTGRAMRRLPVGRAHGRRHPRRLVDRAARRRQQGAGIRRGGLQPGPWRVFAQWTIDCLRLRRVRPVRHLRRYVPGSRARASASRPRAGPSRGGAAMARELFYRRGSEIHAVTIARHGTSAPAHAYSTPARPFARTMSRRMANGFC